jgi:hypothetical protein
MVLSVNQMNTDLGVMISDMPVSFTWSGTVYTGARSSISKGDSPETGGFLTEYDFRITAQTSQFTSGTPNVGDTITFSGKDYKIQDVRQPQDTTNALIFELGSTDG